jgi:hypothetical protein
MSARFRRFRHLRPNNSTISDGAASRLEVFVRFLLRSEDYGEDEDKREVGEPARVGREPEPSRPVAVPKLVWRRRDLRAVPPEYGPEAPEQDAVAHDLVGGRYG